MIDNLQYQLQRARILFFLRPKLQHESELYCIGYKWEIITPPVRITRSFHPLVFPLLALQISSSWYFLWPHLIHSFMKLSQAPAEIINYSSLECLYLRRSQYWMCIYLKAPSLVCPPRGLGLLFSFKQWNEMYSAQNTLLCLPTSFRELPIKEVWTLSDSIFLLCLSHPPYCFQPFASIW